MKKFTLLMAIVMVVASFSGCGNNAGDSDTTTDGAVTEADGVSDSGTSRDDVIVHVEAPWDTMDPHGTGAYVDRYLINQMYEFLTHVEDDGSISPSLATDWTISDDGLTYDFTLRDGVLFHNGEPLTANDVVFSFNRAKGISQMYDYTVMIDTVEATGENTVRFTLNAPFAPFLSYLNQVGILNEKFVTENNDNINKVACGTGPYVLKEIDMNTEAVFEAFSDYYKGEASIKNIKFRVIIDTTAYIMAFQAGEVDFVYPNAITYLEMEQGDEFNTAGLATLHTAVINVNNEVEPFDNKLVRQALNYAADRETMIIIAFEGLADPARLLAAEAAFGVDYAYAKEYEYDLDKAKELLAEAGYPDGLDLGQMYTISGGYHEKIAQVFQSSLAQIGVTVEIMPMESTTLINMMDNGEYTFGNMGLSYSNDFAYNSRYYTTDSIGSSNYDRYSNERVDELFKLAEAETNPDVRKEYYDEAVSIITDDAPDIPIFHKQLLFAWAKDLNVVPHVDSGKPYFVYEWSWN